MFALLFAAWALSQVAAQDQFFWSYKTDNTTSSYEPLFEICGSSCSDCDPDAKACFAENWSNLCFEPKLGETCCKDQFGSTFAAFEPAYERSLTRVQQAAMMDTTAPTMKIMSRFAVLRYVENSQSEASKLHVWG